MATEMMLENSMVVGQYYDDPAPDWTCPHCRREWYEESDGSWVDDGTESHNGHPRHGKGCVACVYDGRTQEDAFAFAMEQKAYDLDAFLRDVISDIGVHTVLRALHDLDPDVVGQNAEAWAEDQEEYREWVLEHKEV